KKLSRKTVVVLCDLSESTRNVRGIYLESFKKAISPIGHGDVFVVAKITDSSITEPEIPIEEAHPEFVAKDKMGNPTDNPILVKNAKKEADERLQKRKEELIETAKNLLLGERDKGRKIMHTDIMSSLHIAERIIKNYRRDKPVLVILSDMVEDSSEYNFEREKLTDKRIEQIVQNEKKKNRIPDLNGVKVYIVAAGVRSSKRFFAIQNFWLRYFKECGANLSKENYGSVLLSFNE
ncbi:MAG: hypothetical protein ACUVUQ_01975, partial [Thermodesulfovibrionales bacterium]